MAVKSFSTLVSESINGYKDHIGIIAKVAFVIYFIPTLIISILKVSYYNYYTSGIKHFLVDYPLGILENIFLFLLIFSVIKIITIKKTNKNISFKDALKFSFSHLGDGFHLLIRMTIFLIGLYLAFIIPGIIFSIFWIFSFYALISDNVDPKDAMAHSKRVVEGRWWKVFGYAFALGLIVTVATFIVMFGVSLYYGVSYFDLVKLISEHVAYIEIPVTIINLILSLIFVPFQIIFFEKLYLNLKENTANRLV